MALFNAVLVLALLAVVFQGYKWYRIHQLATSRDPAPPRFWTLALWPRTAIFLIFGAIIAWALADWLIHGR